jgi:cysteine synthase A
MILPSVTATVGRTPLVELRRLSAGLPGQVVAKLDARNPGGSVKDRIGLAMIEASEKAGLLQPGATLVEATSGNTGIALALVAAAKGYKLIVTMPETMSRERVSLLRYLGAQVVLTPRETLMRGAVERAAEILRQTPGALMVDQFKNPANPEVHRKTTALEIWEDTGGEVDAFVAGVGTGGTITGVGEVLKSRRPGVQVVAVEPAKCAVLSGGKPGHHLIQGIGAGFVPQILNRSIIDEVITVTEDEAFNHARRLAREEGISAGISSGAAVCAALKVASRLESQGKRVVVMVPDGGERYVTTPLMDELSRSDGS